MEGQVRELLRRQAEAVPPQLAVPPMLAGRAHRRFAVNALGAAAVAIVLVAGVFAGLRTIGGAPVNQPGASPGDSGSTTIGPCTAPQLRATAAMEGAAGSREGEILFTNVSDATCTLEGTQSTWLLDVNGDRIDGIDFISSPARWEVNGDPKPAGWPVVTLTPGDRASMRLRWSNWCVGGALTWDMPLAGEAGIVTIDGLAQDPPPCNGPDQPSTIEVGPFEPSGP